jgi:RNA polymerase sigma factor (sigma-70 family)
LRHAIAGDENALVALLQAHAPRLRRYVEPRIPKRFRAVIGVDDVLQQTYVDAYRDVGRLNPDQEHAFAAWLEVIAEQNLLDAIRMLETKKRGGDRMRAQRAARDDSCRDLIELLSGRSSTPTGKVTTREAIRHLDSAVGSLPAVYQAVVEMYDLQGRPIDDVARELERSPGAIFMLRARAHRMLAEIIGSTG